MIRPPMRVNLRVEATANRHRRRPRPRIGPRRVMECWGTVPSTNCARVAALGCGSASFGLASKASPRHGHQ